MENSEFTGLFKRAEDLAARCERSCMLTSTAFLTPAEKYALTQWSGNRSDVKLLFSGGHEACERTVAFFLPEYMEREYFDPGEYIKVIRLRAFFGAPGHRDYMGALLGMGIERSRLGDIWVRDDTAVVFCLPGIEKHLLGIDKVGRYTVKAEEIPLDGLAAPERNVKKISFTVMSPRLDAVAGGMFNISRTEAARHISAGNVSVNYSVSDKTDMMIKEGDIVSLRGSGKGEITGTGGTSRKGRLYIYADIYK